MVCFLGCPSGGTNPPYDGGYDVEIEEGYEAEITVQCEGEGTQCDDKNLCTYDDKCVKGVCIGSEKKCDDKNQCTNDYCDLNTGECKYAPLNDNAACDDGNICTEGDKCQKGVCESGENKCDCMEDKDCAIFEDNDFCNGTFYCDETYKCGVDPATVVVCKDTDDTDCRKNLCVKATGLC
ncbi:MAG: hypothetical protein FJ088_00955, partial [Deltaproteobacteria bacterium]|nr:hypothetical protein [Deltaproteobacteria bacterium]